MKFKEINITALRLNRNKYLSSFVINTFYMFFFVVITAGIVLTDYFLTDKILNINTVLLNLIRTALFLMFMILAAIVSSSVSMGQTAVFSGRINRKKASFKRILYWLKPSKSLKALGLNLTLILLKIMWASAFLFPGSVILTTIVYLAFTGGIEIYLLLSLFISGTVLILAGAIFTFIITQRYFLAKFLLAENTKLGVIQVIKQSKNLMEFQLMTVVKFKLSYIFPFILSFLIFPLIFLYPHYKQSISILAKELTV